MLVRIHFIIVMIRWTGLAPWEFEFPFLGSLTSTFLDLIDKSCGTFLSSKIDEIQRWAGPWMSSIVGLEFGVEGAGFQVWDAPVETMLTGHVLSQSAL